MKLFKSIQSHAFLAASLLALSACGAPVSNDQATALQQGSPTVSKPAAAAKDRVEGASKSLFGAEAKSWIKLDTAGKVSEVAVTLPLAAVQTAPTDAAQPPTQLALELPSQGGNPFRFIGLDYGPGGHPPPNVYTVPHFDIHFYTMSQTEVAAIDCSDKALPDSTRLPAPYIFIPPTAPECVPQMGYHAANPTSPELKQENPEKFSKTVILGYYRGNLNFVEPMVTREYLLTKQGFSLDIPKPQALGASSLFPTRAEGRLDGEFYQVVLSQFVQIP